MGPQSFPDNQTMKIFAILSAVSLVCAAPAPQEEAVEDPQIVAYVHEEVEALPYVHEEIEALPYVHDATGDVSDDTSAEAVPYVHEEIEAVPYVHEEPAQPVLTVPVASPVLSYAYAPALTPYAAYVVKGAEAGVKLAVVSPYIYQAATGCVNSVGSVVPCAL